MSPSKERLLTFFMMWHWSKARNSFLLGEHGCDTTGFKRAVSQVAHHCGIDFVVVTFDSHDF